MHNSLKDTEKDTEYLFCYKTPTSIPYRSQYFNLYQLLQQLLLKT